VSEYLGKWQFFIGIIALFGIGYYVGATIMRKKVLSQVE
jgi:hypothetical protein